MNLHSCVGAGFYGVLPMVIVHNMFLVFDLRTQNPLLWERWMWAYVPIFGGYEFFSAVDSLIRKEYAAAAVSTACGAWVTYMWWNDENNRRKRKKLFDRAAARIAVIGSRLRVVRPSEG